MRRVLLLIFASCTTRVELPVEPLRPEEEAMALAFSRADTNAERAMRDALAPGTSAATRDARLAQGELLDEGRALFVTDAPWRGTEAVVVRPLHQPGQRSADATRCAGCHHTGGLGGAGAFADRTFLDASADDVTTAQVRAPRMLAGAAVLQLLDERALGWSANSPRTLREQVEHAIEWHLGETKRPLEVDALITAIAALPLPSEEVPERDSLRLRVAAGRERFRAYGCEGCHTPALPLTHFELPLSNRRVLNVERSVRAQLGVPVGPVKVMLYSDLHLHDVGTGSENDPGPFSTPPLWGLSTRLTFLHDGRASTFDEAIRAHGGEALAARTAWEADQEGRRELSLFLLTLTRPTQLEGSP